MRVSSSEDHSEITQLREQAGLTQKEAADKLDMKTRTFGSYERGERTPDYKTMDRIRQVLGNSAEPSPTPPHDRRAYEIPVPHPVGDRETLVVDRREAERRYGNALGKVRAHRIRSSSMERVASRGAWVEYLIDTDYQGPGMYLVSLTGERPWPAYVRKFSHVELEIEKTGKEAPIRLVRESRDAKWSRKDRGAVDFVLHGICERWDQDTVDL